MEISNISKFKIRKFTKAFSEIKYTISVNLLSHTFTIKRTSKRNFVNEHEYDFPDSYANPISLLNKLPTESADDNENKTTDIDVWYKAIYFDTNNKKYEILFTSKEENSISLLILNWIKDKYRWVEDVHDF